MSKYRSKEYLPIYTDDKYLPRGGNGLDPDKKSMDPEYLLEPDPSSRCDNLGPKTLKYFIKRLPIITWLPKYSPSDVISDSIAGITVGLTVIPQGIAYALVAGLPAQYGLYSAFMGCFVYTIFGSTKDITIGPTAIMALMTASHASYGPAYAILLAFFTGLIILGFGILQLGFLIDFISVPVIAGFTSAAALTIATGQVKSLLGIQFPEHYHKSHTHVGVVDPWIDVFSNIQFCKWQDAVLGIFCAIILLLLRALNRTNWFKPDTDGTATGVQAFFNRLPPLGLKILSNVVWLICTARNAIIVISCLILAGFADPECLEYLKEKQDHKGNESAQINGSCTFTITGPIPPGLPNFTIPSFSTYSESGDAVSFGEMMSTLGSATIVIPLIAILENMAIAKAFSGGKPVDASQEMIALGLCNLIGSFVSSMPTTGSFSRTAVNSNSGVKTPLAGVFTGGLVLLCLAFLMPYCAFIPKATLAAVIMTAVIFSVEHHVIMPMWKSKRIDLIPGFACFLGCLFYELEIGIGIGVIVQIFFILYSSARPPISVQLKQCPDDSSREFLLVTIQQGVIFPSVTHVRNLINKAGVRQAGPYIPVIVDCSRMSDTDFTAAEGFKSMISDFEKRKTSIYWLNPNSGVTHTLASVSGKKFRVISNIMEVFQTDLENQREVGVNGGMTTPPTEEDD